MVVGGVCLQPREPGAGAVVLLTSEVSNCHEMRGVLLKIFEF